MPAVFKGVTFVPVDGNKTNNLGQVTLLANYEGNAPFTLKITETTESGATSTSFEEYKGDTYTLKIKVVGTSGEADVTFPY